VTSAGPEKGRICATGETGREKSDTNGSLFGTEDSGSTFLRNVAELDCVASQHST
jgi:hypothetical protein